MNKTFFGREIIIFEKYGLVLLFGCFLFVGLISNTVLLALFGSFEFGFIIRVVLDLFCIVEFGTLLNNLLVNKLKTI